MARRITSRSRLKPGETLSRQELTTMVERLTSDFYYWANRLVYETARCSDSEDLQSNIESYVTERINLMDIKCKMLREDCEQAIAKEQAERPQHTGTVSLTEFETRLRQRKAARLDENETDTEG